MLVTAWKAKPMETTMQYSRAATRHMLLPKGKHKTFVPVMEHFWLPSVLGKLAPPERRAMAEIVDNADVLTVDGAIWLLIPVRRQETLDVLAAFGAEGEDRENDLEDEEEVDISRRACWYRRFRRVS